mmetsp:Transcript_38604/g.93542  ORF Transcript_38604/g.93542 Transcript_38604/m.93542 type:complete len:99 (-) Transcript_38604:655-951(-)
MLRIVRLEPNAPTTVVYAANIQYLGVTFILEGMIGRGLALFRQEAMIVAAAHLRTHLLPNPMMLAVEETCVHMIIVDATVLISVRIHNAFTQDADVVR